jgi:DNA-directed RNA polymerase subunit alpha
MLLIQRPIIEAVGDETNNTQAFRIGPLDTGFGHTLGNSLRRTLLSSIPGAAATRVKFDKVLHEFGVIDGVKEDVQDVCLNLKDLLVRLHSEEPVVLHLEKKGEGPVYASDLSTTADVEILNPDLQIAYLTSASAELVFELTVEQGKGYVGAEGNKGSSTIGVIPLDSIFTPVRRVSISVEPKRSESRDQDVLVIEIETDGSITPQDALASAGKTMGELVTIIANLNLEAPAPKLGDVSAAEAAASELDNTRIEDLGLSERSRNCLKRAGINTIAQLINATERDLTSITNFGATSLKDVTDRLDERGLSLRVED